MKRFCFGLALLLGLLLCGGALAARSGNFSYRIENGCAVDVAPVKSWRNQQTEITVPDTLGGCPVTELIHSAFAECGKLKALHLPDTLRAIPAEMCAYCTALKTITLPAGVTAIGETAFAESGLTKITLPASVKTIGTNAFYGCAALEEVAGGSGLTAIGDNAFYACGALRSVSLPDSVTAIGQYAFSDCASLESLRLPARLSRVGDYAFWGCSSLAVSVAESSLHELGYGAFYGILSIDSLTFTGKQVTLGDYALNDLLGLPVLTFAEGVERITVAAHTFDPYVPETISLPGSLHRVDGGDLPNTAHYSVPEDSWAEEYAWSHGLMYDTRTVLTADMLRDAVEALAGICDGTGFYMLGDIVWMLQ